MMQKCLYTGDKLYDVVPISDYYRSPQSYVSKGTAIDIGQDHVFPVISDLDKGPGIVIKQNKPIAICKNTDSDEMDKYESSKCIDFSKSESMGEFMEKQTLLHQLEKDVLSNPDNIFAPDVDPSEAPAMQLLKKAVTTKHIDLDKYESRFGSNYANDKRLFNKPSISMQMLTRVCNALDIKATLTLEDQVGDIANPMGPENKMSIELTNAGGGIIEDE